MEEPEEQIHSFVIKFWLEDIHKKTGRAVWRGHITHAASSKERYLDEAESLLTFIKPYLSNKRARRDRRWSQQIKEDLAKLIPVVLSFFIVLATGALIYWLNKQYFQAGLLGGSLLGPILAPVMTRWTDGSNGGVAREDSALYLEGKMKQYSLLFSVNGGVFVIAKLIKEGPLSSLGMIEVSIGAAIFTVIMTADIWLWGVAMREKHGVTLFRPIGQTIVLLIGALLFSGWILVCFPKR